MAYIDDVLDKLAVTINGWLAPYQPNLPPTYPNPASTAGQIPPTLVSAGRPIQVKVTTRLENKMSQVAVYDQAPERIRPFFNKGALYDQGGGNIGSEAARSEKRVVVEVWSYDRPTRRAIQDIIRQNATDCFTQTENDGTTTKFRYLDSIPFDMEQKDSFYITQIHLQADFVVLSIDPGAPVTEIDTSITVEAIDGTSIFTEVITTT